MTEIPKKVVAAKADWENCYEAPGPDIFKKAYRFQDTLLSEEGSTPCLFRRPILSATGGKVLMLDSETGKCREMLMMGSNSYFALNSDDRVVSASIAAARKYGYGTGSVSLYTGTTDLHLELEKRIARFYRCEDALLFPTGYAANLGALAGLLRKGDVVVNDMFNHASIFDGCLLSGAKILTFAHASARHLRKTLRGIQNSGCGILVVTDGVFSMDGDVALLSEIWQAAHEAGARVMIDEAHALGVVGPGGRGTAEANGMEGQVDVTVGTLSKLPGGIGGYVAGSKALTDYLRFYARPYFFSTSIPTPVVAGLIEVFNILETDKGPRERLWRNITYMVENLRALGFDLGNTASAIVPIMVGDEAKLKAIAIDLHRRGIIMSYVAYPAVPRKRCRLRMSLMAQHTLEDLDLAISTLEELGKKHGVLAS